MRRSRLLPLLIIDRYKRPSNGESLCARALVLRYPEMVTLVFLLVLYCSTAVTDDRMIEINRTTLGDARNMHKETLLLSNISEHSAHERQYELGYL